MTVNFDCELIEREESSRVSERMDIALSSERMLVYLNVAFERLVVNPLIRVLTTVAICLTIKLCFSNIFLSKFMEQNP